MKEHEMVVLAEDLPAHGLRKGDVGTIVLVHNDGEGYEMEFVALDGETVALAQVRVSQVRPVARREIIHARAVAG